MNFCERRLKARPADGTVRAFGGGPTASAPDLGRTLLFWEMGLSRQKGVPLASLMRPWTAPPNSFDKYFDPQLAAIRSVCAGRSLARWRIEGSPTISKIGGSGGALPSRIGWGKRSTIGSRQRRANWAKFGLGGAWNRLADRLGQVWECRAMPGCESSSVSELARRLAAGEFALTAEITPPVSGSAQVLLDKALPLKGHLDAVNVTDGASARVHMSSLASAAILVANGIEPVLQFTCRDRNRIALMGDLLGAAALGIHNLLLLTGDNPTVGDQPEAKPVFDLSSQGLIELAATMSTRGLLPSSGGKARNGVLADMRAIDGPPEFFVGAADMPTAAVSDCWRDGLHAKVAAGARFMQTQVCYDLDVMRRYAELLRVEGVTDTVSVLISNGPLASARSAVWMRENLFGVLIPDDVVERLAQADDPEAEGVRICQEQIQAMAEIPGISGCHLIAPTNPGSIPEAVTGLELGNRRS